MELLEEVRTRAGLAYISDIPVRLPGSYSLFYLQRIPLRKYPIKEWNDALQYCLGGYVHISEVSSYKEIQRLLEHIN